MEPQTTFIGFEPTKEFLEQLNEGLFQLSNILPYDASLLVRAVRSMKTYEITATAYFVGGKMEAICHGPILDSVMSRTIDRIYRQICEWHTSRFKDEPVLSPGTRKPAEHSGRNLGGCGFDVPAEHTTAEHSAIED